jgi:hypothetical protein
MPYVSFISDAQFRQNVTSLLQVGEAALKMAEAKFHRNVIDPFSMLIEMACFDLTVEKWRIAEKQRQSQKSLSNEIGKFHQKMLGCVTGWQNLEPGNIVDLVNPDLKIIAEVKNKHNTVKGSDKCGIFKSLESLVMPKASQYKGYHAYFVELIPNKSKRYNKPFQPSDNKQGTRCEANPLISQIDGASFYALITGVDNALEQVFEALPQVIKDCKHSFGISDRDLAQVNAFFKAAFSPE